MFDFRVVLENIPVLLKGLKFTLSVSILTIGIALFAGTVLALLRLSKANAIRIPCIAYISVFRCTPTLIHLAWVYFVLPLAIGIP